MRKFSRFVLAALFFAAAIPACSLLSDPDDGDEKPVVTAISFEKELLEVDGGGSDYLKYTIEPASIQNSVNVVWDYDDQIISIDPDRYGVVVTGLRGGQTWLKATSNGITATCLVTVLGFADGYEGDPYIYSNFTVAELRPGDNTTVSASLYGGTLTDLEDFTWEIKDPSVASISYARGSCVVTAKKVGSTQLVAKHPKAAFDYTMVVFCYTDKFTESYITTDQNVMLINKAEQPTQTISFKVKNPLSENYQGGFHYEIVNNGEPVFTMVTNRENAQITGVKNGIGLLRVTHDNCQFSMDVLVRVTTAVENVYILPSTTTLIMTGSDDNYSVTCEIVGTDKHVDSEAWRWNVYDVSDKRDPNYGQEVTISDKVDWVTSGNTISLKGKKNGAFRVKVSHELAEFSRTILVILREQIGSAIDNSMYITTTQNLVKTQVGAEDTEVVVTLVGAGPGDENDIEWRIENGENNDICKLTTPTGKIFSKAAGSVAIGKLVISPLKMGEAKVTIHHPKIAWDTEIVIKVLSQYAMLKEPVYLKTENDISVIKMLNKTPQGADNTYEAGIKILLSGNVASGDENKIKWTSENTNVITVSPDSGPTTYPKAKANSGSQRTYITASHEKMLAGNEKKVLVLSADTEEALEKMKALYADTTYFRVNVNNTCTAELKGVGFKDADKTGITWTTSDPKVCDVNAQSDRFKATLTGRGMGEATITATHPDCNSVQFNVVVLPEGESTGLITSSYLTTDLNAVVITEFPGGTADLNVSGANISKEDMAKTKWTIRDDKIASVNGNGGTAVVTSKDEGITQCVVTNPASENELTINVKVGALYSWADDFYVYITTEEDTILMTLDETKTIGAKLENSTKTTGFRWNVTGKKNIVEATGTNDGLCILEAKEAGMTELTITNQFADFEKTVLVVVASDPEELAAFRYLTTDQNVVTVGQTMSETVQVTVKNAPQNVVSGFNWTSSNPAIVDVVGSGGTAVFYGKRQGTAKITVTNTSAGCVYPLEIIANCVDPIQAAAHPYITCQNIITLHVGDESSTLVADLIGGTEADYTGFRWTCQDKSVCQMLPSNETAQVKALKPGATQLVISHPKAGGVDRTVLVICEPKIETDCYITVTESIIKMSPTDGPKTITATLVGGTEQDKANFKWWPDNFDLIEMSAGSNENCIVKPIAAGTVTIHCSHPRAAFQKDIILNISQYDTFAFEQSAVDLEAGKQSFVNMQVPVTGVKTKVVYSVKTTEGKSAVGILGVNGTDSVCVLSPQSPGTCVVTANLVSTASGQTQSSAQLLVNVKASNYLATYIDYTGPTMLTLNKGEEYTLKAKLGGPNAPVNGERNIKWKISDPTALSISPPPKLDGCSYNDQGEVKITALRAGSESTITLSHNQADTNVVIYVIVPGDDWATIMLSPPRLNLILGTGASITAEVKNPSKDGTDTRDIKWEVIQNKVENEKDNIISLNASGTSAKVTPLNVGSALIRATVPSSGMIATTIVTVEPMSSIVFSTASVNLIPTGDENDAVTVKYTVSPATETGKLKWKWGDFGVAEYKDDRNGTLLLWGKKISTNNPKGYEVTTLTATFEDGSVQSSPLTIKNGWGESFSLSKTLIKDSPENIDNKVADGVFDTKFTVSPASATIEIENVPPGIDLYIDGKPLPASQKAEQSFIKRYKWTIKNEDITNKNLIENSAEGVITFRPQNKKTECNTNYGTPALPIQITAYNKKKTDGDQYIGGEELTLMVGYEKYNIKVTNFRSEDNPQDCWFKYKNGTLYIVPGEPVYFQIYPKEHDCADWYENKLVAKPTIRFTNSQYANLHNKYQDLGCQNAVAPGYLTGANAVEGYQFMMSAGQKFKRATSEGGDTESHNYIKSDFLGTIEYTYYTIMDGVKHTYEIPVYIVVRNCGGGHSDDQW